MVAASRPGASVAVARRAKGDAVAKAVQIAKAKPLVETTREDIGLMMRDAMRGVEFM